MEIIPYELTVLLYCVYNKYVETYHYTYDYVPYQFLIDYHNVYR